jgi:hypothetical protein
MMHAARPLNRLRAADAQVTNADAKLRSEEAE